MGTNEVGMILQGVRKNPPIIEQIAMEIHYPLVICDIAIEHDHRNSGFSHEKWVDLSIAMLNYQRVAESKSSFYVLGGSRPL